MRRNRKQSAPSRALIAGVLGGMAAVFSGNVGAIEPLLFPVKLTPATLSVQADGASPEVTSELGARAWDLFDRDTRPNGFRVTRSMRLVVDLGEMVSIAEIRVRGTEAARLSVNRDDGTGGWATIAGLNSIDLDAHPVDRWRRLPTGGHVTTRRLSFELTPRNTQAATTGLVEIEVWGPRSTMPSLTLGALGRAVRESTLAFPYESIAPSGSADLAVTSAAGAQARFLVPRDIRVYRRAWLVYDVQGATSGVGVKRSWNSLPVRGGYQRDAVVTGAWTQVTEELDPSWLRAGQNTLDVRMSDQRAIRLRNVRLVTELETGRNAVSSIHANAELDVLRDGDASTRWAVPAEGGAIHLELDRLVELDSVAVSVPGARQGTAVLEAWKDGAWVAVETNGTISTTAWVTGWNEVRATSAIASHSFRLRFAPSEPGLEISGISLAGSAFGAAHGLPRFVVRAPESGEYWDDESYLWGWVVPAQVGGQVANVTIGGTAAPRDPDGAFARTVTRTDSTTGSASAGPWEVKVEATLADGTTLTRYVQFTDDRASNDGTGPVASADPDDDGVGESTPERERRGGGGSVSSAPKRNSKRIKPSEGGEVALGRCDVVIPPFALREETEIVVESIEEPELPGLGPALHNVSSPGAGCRFLPHGKFDKPVRVRVPYDANMLPDGHSEDEISSHYYDTDLQQWLPLEKIAVQKGTQQVLSETDHFTDVIDGILVLPDHPSPLSYNPNSIKDLKAASPTAGIDFIEPPSANQTGAANVGFAIRVPPGRGGAEPSLSVRYSSGGGNGPMGLGWSLSTTSISIDTRFGVPRYTGSELYTLDGSQLVPVPSKPGHFQQRIEGAFLQIIRHGDDATNYSWEVTSKDGSRAIYGASPNARLTAPEDPANVFQWFLEKTIDPNGNTVTYTYLQDRKPENPSGRLDGHPWVAAYLQKVQYSGHESGEQGRYSVELEYSDDIKTDTPRPDLVIDGRPGFKTLWRKVLRSATVKFDQSVVRKYVFEYEEGAFQKALLVAVALRGKGDAEEFYRHSFEYEQPPRDQNGKFAPFAGVPSVRDGAVSHLPLSQTESTTTGGSLFLGLSFGPSRRRAFGARVGKEVTENEGVITLADVNGDGLSDQVMPGKVRLGTNDGEFTSSIPVSGLPQIEEGNTRSMTVGFEAAGFGLAFVNGNTEAERILTDINGDGFVDLVGKGSVKLNHPGESGVPDFSGEATGPENPGDFAVVSESAQRALEDRAFVVNPIARWVAPFSGEIVISGAAMRVDTGGNTAIQGRTRFGLGNLVASVWIDQPSDVDDLRLWRASFAKLEHTGPSQAPATEDGAPLRLRVEQGKRIYFRVDGSGDIRGARLRWSPRIQYECYDKGGECRTASNLSFDPFGRQQFVYDRGFDFTTRGFAPDSWAPPQRGKIRIDGRIRKGRTTHDVTFQLRKGPPDAGGEIVFKRFADANEEIDDPFVREDFTVVPRLVGDGDDKTQEAYTFEIISNGDVYGSTNWTSTLEYTAICEPSRGAPPSTIFNPDSCRAPLEEERQPTHIEAGSFVKQWTGPAAESERIEKRGKVLVTGTVFIHNDRTRLPGDPPHSAEAMLLGVNRRHQVRSFDSVPAGNNFGLGVPAEFSREIDVVPGDRLFLRVEGSPGTAIAGGVGYLYTEICERNPESGELECESVTQPGGSIPVQVYEEDRTSPGAFLGGIHRWWVSGWNGNDSVLRGRYFLDSPEPDIEVHPQPWVISARRGVDAWLVGDGGRVDRFEMNPGRLSADADGFFEGPSALRKANSETIAVSADAWAAGLSLSYTNHSSRLDLFDFNGDRIPDQIRENQIALNGPTGNPVDSIGLDLGSRKVRESHGLSVGVNVGGGRPNGSCATYRGNPKVCPEEPPNDAAPRLFTSSGGANYALNLTVDDWVDVNGDGLPDAVHRKPGEALKVRLNLGYRLGSEETWDADRFGLGDPLSSEPYTSYFTSGLTNTLTAKLTEDAVQLVSGVVENQAQALRVDNTLSVNFTTGIGGSVGSFGGGVGVTGTFGANRTTVDFVDMHGDGLSDLVMKRPDEPYFRVKPNLGGDWGDEERWSLPPGWGGNLGDLGDYYEDLLKSVGIDGLPWPGGAGVDYTNLEAVRSSGTLSVGANAYFSIGIPVPPIPFPIWIIIAPSFSHTKSYSGLEIGLQDVDGDGLVDYAFKAQAGFGKLSGGSSELRLKRNQVGPTNLLKRVVRPLGSHFVMHYERAPNSVKNPLAQWTLVEVNLTDEFTPETYKTSFAYANGVYDRADREFLGFGTVITRDAVGREVEQTFDVSAYHRQGLLLETVVRGERNALSLIELPRDRVGTFSRPVWTKTVHTYSDRVLIPGTPERPKSAFPRRTETVTHFYEGVVNPSGPGTKSSTERFEYDDFGNLKHYEELGEATPADDVIADVVYASLPGYRKAFPSRLTVHGTGGTLLRERTASYDGEGNLLSLTTTLAGGASPTSHLTWDDRGNLLTFTDAVGYRITYQYDPTVRTYVTQVSDSFGYTSTATHDFFFGLPLVNTDLNREKTEYRYDAFGRTTAIFGPKEFGGSVPAFAMDYHLGSRPGSGGPGQRPFAVTRNKEDLSGAGTLDTATVVDGLGRVVQVQTEAEVLAGGTKAHGVIVSGRVTYDAAGRVTTQEQPAFAAGFPNGYVNASGGRPTHFTFDPLDRTTKVTLPDGSITLTNYGFSEGLHRTEVIDAENRRRVSLADVRGNVTAIDEILSGRAIRTRYRYSALSELLEVTDAKGNRTSIAYDSLGRRTRFDNPDRGRIDYSYDPAGNLIRVVDDNLRASGEAIEYRYEFSRLLEVVYPRSPHVLYEYGAPNAPFRRAGRIAKIADESGIEERFYGSLGELEKSVKTVRSVTGPEFSGTYTTSWTYDTFGRMREITYPDGEVLTYQYDRGGRVISAVGKKRGKTTRYLDDVAYDAFGSRVKLTLGNGVVTQYAYDPNRRWLAFLKTTTPQGEVLQELSYTFDRVGNILKLADSGIRGGVQEFSYDTLDRLKTAQGTAKLRNGKETRYQNAFDYDDIHNLTKKVQTHVIDPGPTPVDTNYTLTLTYDGPKPHALTSDGEKKYLFDANGNQLGWDRIQGTGGGAPRRRITWNEENRISSIADPGPNTVEHLYDAGGQRIVKRGRYGETATVNAFFTARNASVFTKHIFVGETRIASHVVYGGRRQIARAPATTAGTLVASAGSVAASDGAADSSHDSGSEGGDGDVEPPGAAAGSSGNGNGQGNAGGNGSSNAHGNNPQAQSHGADPCQQGKGRKKGLDCDGSEEPPPPGGDPGGPSSGSGRGAAHRVFFYHPDHLGSSSWLSDAGGRVWERLAYFPFGEVWIDEGTLPGGPNQDFRFTGKEQDPETGLYYFGARYLEPRSQAFLSVDPVLETSSGTSRQLAAYLITNGNPLLYVDPDGRNPYRWWVGTNVSGRSILPSWWPNTGNNELDAFIVVVAGSAIPVLTVGAVFYSPELFGAVLTGAISAETLVDAAQVPGATKDVIQNPSAETAVALAATVADTVTGAPVPVAEGATFRRWTRGSPYPQGDIDPSQIAIYRGGTSFKLKQGEFKLDRATGLVQSAELPTARGPSLDLLPENVAKHGGAFRVRRLPAGLKIQQRGKRPEHFEILPAEPMSEHRFQELLDQIQVESAE